MKNRDIPDLSTLGQPPIHKPPKVHAYALPAQLDGGQLEAELKTALGIGAPEQRGPTAVYHGVGVSVSGDKLLVHAGDGVDWTVVTRTVRAHKPGK